MILNFKVVRKSDGVEMLWGSGASYEEIHEQLKPYYDHKTFGNPEQPELKELQDVLITPAVLDPETGEELEPAVYEQQEVVVRPYTPAEYTIEITDVTATVSAQQEMSEITADLQAEDYKVTKFREQQELGIDTDMTVAEYTLLLAQRQAKRTRYREIETLLGLR